jgi:predicted nucleic acid-binding protein
LNFVLDASITLSWAFPDEWDQAAVRVQQVLESSGGTAIVPGLWWFEVRNILIVNERRGRITAEDTSYFLDQLSKMNITTSTIKDNAVLLDLARQHKLSVYDSAYLTLALEQGIPLATLDSALQRAARAVNVPLLS